MGYLDRYGRYADLPVYYEDLLHFNASFPFYDKDDKDTLWETVVYDPSADRRLNHDLTMIYSLLNTAGDTYKAELCLAFSLMRAKEKSMLLGLTAGDRSQR